MHMHTCTCICIHTQAHKPKHTGTLTYPHTCAHTIHTHISTTVHTDMHKHALCLHTHMCSHTRPGWMCLRGGRILPAAVDRPSHARHCTECEASPATALHRGTAEKAAQFGAGITAPSSLSRRPVALRPGQCHGIAPSPWRLVEAPTLPCAGPDAEAGRGHPRGPCTFLQPTQPQQGRGRECAAHGQHWALGQHPHVQAHGLAYASTRTNSHVYYAHRSTCTVGFTQAGWSAQGFTHAPMYTQSHRLAGALTDSHRYIHTVTWAGRCAH